MIYMDQLERHITWLKVADKTYYLIQRDRYFTAIEEELLEDILRIWTDEGDLFVIQLHRLHDQTKHRPCFTEST